MVRFCVKFITFLTQKQMTMRTKPSILVTYVTLRPTIPNISHLHHDVGGLEEYLNMVIIRLLYDISCLVIILFLFTTLVA